MQRPNRRGWASDMDVGNSNAVILPAAPAPFALIITTRTPGDAAAAVETSMRHMGLRPERVDADQPDIAVQIAAPHLFLRFGDVSAIAGQAADAARTLADPEHPATSLLAASLPRDWRESGQCWAFMPDDHLEQPAPAIEQHARMRKFFKMMVLAIDMFDASHFFWSPARLWSDAPQFRSAIAEMLTSGMPPVLHLVAFRRQESDGVAIMATRGLALFAGQELEAAIPPGWTVAEMVRRLSRLALDMMIHGPVRDARTTRGLEAGEWIDLSIRAGRLGEPSTVMVAFGRDG